MSDLSGKEWIFTLTFYYQDQLKVVLAPTVEDFFKITKSSSYRLETGGIIVGTLNSGPTITITDITRSQPNDIRQRFRFFRSASRHQLHMDQLWKESGYRKMYLGEWHTHSEPIPSPSKVDIGGWKSIAKKEQNSPWMLFIILGQCTFRIWTVDKGKVKELTLSAN